VVADLVRFVLGRNDRAVRLVAILTVPVIVLAVVLAVVLIYLKVDPLRWLQAAIASLGVLGTVKGVGALRQWRTDVRDRRAVQDDAGGE
jgi:hypothetical protein